MTLLSVICNLGIHLAADDVGRLGLVDGVAVVHSGTCLVTVVRPLLIGIVVQRVTTAVTATVANVPLGRRPWSSLVVNPQIILGEASP